MGQFLVADGGAEVGEQAQGLAQAEDGLLGAQRTVQRVVLPVAHGAEQDGVGFLRQLERGGRQRMAGGFIAGAAHGAVCISRPRFRASSTLTASATISGPMPSPGKTAIFMMFL